MMMMVLMMIAPAQRTLGEEDDSFLPVPQRPRVELSSPRGADGIGPGGRLKVTGSGRNVQRMEVLLAWDGGTMKLEASGAEIDQTAVLPPIAGRVTVTLHGCGADGACAEDSVELRTPRETLIDDLILYAREIAQDDRQNFLRADDPQDAGTCKNYIARLLLNCSDSYGLLSAPNAALSLPLNADKADCRPWRYGVMWTNLPREAGNPFVEVGSFRESGEKERAANAEEAAAFLRTARRGDVLQFVGNYGDGNGPHTLLLTEDCDGETLTFTDSNRKGKRIGRTRYGWVQFGVRKPVKWLADVLAGPGCGGTLYRLCDEIIRR